MKKYFRLLFGFSAFCTVFCAWAISPTNPRGESQKTIRETDVAMGQARRESGATRVRAASLSQRGTTNSTRVASNMAIRNAGIVSRVGTRGAILSRATSGAPVNARVAKNTVSGSAGVARSATARATAVFNDVSKIGSGYAMCRESYSTCMDQMCANANDTYRRCFCSERFTKFREIEDKLDNAMILLQKFQDTNLDAVDKTAAEVNAMYSATVGEAAIKKDTSAAAKALDDINKLLTSGTSGVSSASNQSSLGILSLDFSSDGWDNIWDTGSGSIFGTSGQDLSSLEGKALFDASQRQCVNLTRENCETDAVFSMARSSYNILITQDCNTYEKNLNKKRETVAAAVRSAEKYLREARLEEYRSHNSSDFNECLDRVRASMLADTACGAGYKRCLDPTGAYINAATGEPIYSPRLFQLEQTIKLEGINNTELVTDILGANDTYAKWLDQYSNRVTRDLDTCRDIANDVWTEFKRNAIIEIAQAQSAKIEEVKSSCVETMAECYDTQTNAIKSFDDGTATTAAALGRYTARDMCHEKVVTCAALFGGTKNNDKCTFDSRGHLTSDGAKCGLTSLLDYVDAVNSIYAGENCESGLREHFEKLCTPNDGKNQYPYKCKDMKNSETDPMGIEYVARTYAVKYCQDPALEQTKKANDIDDTNWGKIDPRIASIVSSVVSDVHSAISYALKDKCESLDGYWFWPSASPGFQATDLSKFYNEVYGGKNESAQKTWGTCYENSAYLKCLAFAEETDDDGKPLASWNATLGQCVLTDEWYRMRCEYWLDGYYENSVCYVGN